MSLSRLALPTTLLGGLLLLCFSSADCWAKEATRLGVVLPFTGRFSDLAEQMKTAAELAVKSNDGQGRSALRLVFADDFANPDSTRLVVERLIAQHQIAALTGGYPSECSAAAAQVAGEHRIPYLISNASWDSLTINSSPFIFRIAPTSQDYNDGLVGFMVSVVGRERRIAVVYENHLRIAEALKDIRDDLLARWTGEVIYEPFETGARDFKPMIERLQQTPPTVVYLLGSIADIATLLMQAREVRWAPAAFIVGSVSQADHRLVSHSDHAAEYAFAPAVWRPSMPFAGMSAFVRTFQEKAGVPPDYHAAEMFAAIQVITEAASSLTSPHPEALRDALEVTNMATVFGWVRFENVGGMWRQNRVQTAVLQLLDGEWQVVWPLNLASANAVYPAPEWNSRPTPERGSTGRNLFPLLVVFVTITLLITTILRRRELARRIGR